MLEPLRKSLITLGVCALSSAAAFAATPLTGAGSTWVYPRVAKWSAAYEKSTGIAKLNPGLHLPDMSISVVHRSDGSGATFTFADYVSKVSPECKSSIGANTSIEWPTGIGGKDNEGVASYAQRIRGAIGYVEYAYILEDHMDYARMINRAGRVVSPSLEGFQAAAANVDFTKAADFYAGSSRTTAWSARTSARAAVSRFA